MKSEERFKGLDAWSRETAGFQKLHIRSSGWKARAIYITAAILLLIVIGLWARPWAATNSPFSSADVERAQFGLYYPRELPDGFWVDDESVDVRSSVAVYQIVYEGNKRIAVTLQPAPDGSGSLELSGDKEISVPLGRLLIVDKPDRTTGSLITEDTWIIMNAPETVPPASLEDITRSMNRAR